MEFSTGIVSSGFYVNVEKLILLVYICISIHRPSMFSCQTISSWLLEHYEHEHGCPVVSLIQYLWGCIQSEFSCFG